MRSLAIRGAALAALCLSAAAWAAPAACDGWPAWQTFRQRFVSGDGRVIDLGGDGSSTTSEGQSYALFFALVANDRPSFDRLLGWTRDNLAAGDLAGRLPAWHWGKRADGSWGVLDENSASDSDLWIAYSLLEAGRLWREPLYVAQGKLLALRALREETADLPGLGPTLLPGKQGFVGASGLVKLNPSYSPPQLIARLARALPDSDWPKLRQSTERVLLDTAPAGFAPDWAAYLPGKGWQPDADSGAIGSYNAIRVYLWAGILSPQTPLRAQLLRAYQPMAEWVAQQGLPPEKVDVRSGKGEGKGPAGFSAALLPFLKASGQRQALQSQQLRLQASPGSERPDAYYEHVLTLFGQGWMDGRYQFQRNGEVKPAWEGACPVSQAASR
ncbi:endo-1,4-D-glucanase [Xenophilus sp. AP218F]|nr:endo-1,4-D-glucanase [Xenophilus sp. AP218F]